MTLRNSQASEKLVTAGEFAKLASTTKRTIHFYDEKQVLMPARVTANGYRYYRENQILDYQMILLLQTFGVSLSELTKFVKAKRGLYKLFKEKQLAIKRQISELQAYANNIDRYMADLAVNGTLVQPEIKELKPFHIFFIEKVGAYSQIGKYCSELTKMLTANKHQKLTTMTIFEDPTYQPKQSRIRVAVIADRELRIKKQFRRIVKQQLFSPGKVITYTHNGSGSLLSLFWKELEKFCRRNKIAVRKDAPDFEIYREVNQDVTKQFFEIYLPVE